MTLPFFKYHGLGNDFLLLESAEQVTADLVRALCDRHFGIGADGVLIVAPEPGFDARMIVLNADGSRPEMCGNGLRCAAFHSASKNHTHAATIRVRLLTDAGPKDCSVAFEPAATTCAVTVDVGRVAYQGSTDLRIDGRQFTVHQADVGNPHAVVFETLSAEDFSRFAPSLATHSFFPEGTNASFAKVTAAREISLRVWERGVGPTLACGTAACAVTAVAARIGAISEDHPTTVQLPGGNLAIHAMPDGRTLMTGPATLVFVGNLKSFPQTS